MFRRLPCAQVHCSNCCRVRRKSGLIIFLAAVALIILTVSLQSLTSAPLIITSQDPQLPKAANATSASTNVIPKIIHQTFATSRVFSAYRKHIESCLRLNPGWQYFLWRDEDIVAFINDHFPFFMRKYLVFKMHVERGDSIRYMVLQHYGGIYIDMDVECVQPFFPRLSTFSAFVDQEAKEHAALLYDKPFSAMNSAMGSVRGHPFFLHMVFAMMQVPDSQGGADLTTGPGLLTKQLIRWRADPATRWHDVTLLEPEVFSPIIDSGGHNFDAICKAILQGGANETNSSTKKEAQLVTQLKESVCRNYQEGKWKTDKTNERTVGRHLFLHLGYRWNKDRLFGLHEIFRNYFGYFEITDVIANPRFYAKHRMN